MKKLICAIMCIALLCGILPAAYAETTLAYVTGSSLKVYQDANTSSKVLGELKRDEVITVVATNGNWCKVKNDKGEIGYCQKSGLGKVWTGSAKGFVSVDSLPVYAKNNTSSQQLGILSRGATVTVVGVAGSWCKIKNSNGKIGFCKKSGLSKTDSNTSKDKCWVSFGGSAIVYGDMKREKVIGEVWYGQCFTLVGITGSWACIKNDNGNTGYIQSSLITKSNPLNQNKTVYLQIPGKVLYAFGSGKAVSTKLSKNTELKLLGAANNGLYWCVVEYKGVRYYIKQKGLLNNKQATDNATYQIKNSTTLYKGNGFSQDIICTLKVGDKIRILEYTDGGHYRVQTEDGKVGYCMDWMWNRIVA